MIDLNPIIESLRKDISKIDETTSSQLEQYHELTKKAFEVTKKFENLWCGGWGQSDYNVYTNPNNRNQYLECDSSFFYEYINKKLSIDVESVGKFIDEMMIPYKKFQRHIITELSVIKGEVGFENEIELLEKIEKFNWGIEASEYIRMQQPNQFVVDMNVLNRGISTPPHIIATGHILAFGTKASSHKKFHDSVTRLLRQLEIKSTKNSPINSRSQEQILSDVFENFHSFCTQLRNRHADRDTILINDEYDVQDLIHCILKLHFKDIREEEYTPSYAGSSTRVDFLLKNENIVIEVKKTRQGLTDRHIGEQLILDVVHYRNHPNCKALICFVYDPESKVKNPRGLEDDLKKLSNSEMLVEVYIRP